MAAKNNKVSTSLHSDPLQTIDHLAKTKSCVRAELAREAAGTYDGGTGLTASGRSAKPASFQESPVSVEKRKMGDH